MIWQIVKKATFYEYEDIPTKDANGESTFRSVLTAIYRYYLIRYKSRYLSLLEQEHWTGEFAGIAVQAFNASQAVELYNKMISCGTNPSAINSLGFDYESYEKSESPLDVLENDFQMLELSEEHLPTVMADSTPEPTFASTLVTRQHPITEPTAAPAPTLPGTQNVGMPPRQSPLQHLKQAQQQRQVHQQPQPKPQIPTARGYVQQYPDYEDDGPSFDNAGDYDDIPDDDYEVEGLPQAPYMPNQERSKREFPHLRGGRGPTVQPSFDDYEEDDDDEI